MSDVEKTIERAQRMLTDLKEAKVPRSRIAKEAGVNEVTLWQIAKGGQTKVSERVFDAIWDYWSEHAPPKDGSVAPEGTSTAAGGVDAGQPPEASSTPKNAVGRHRKAARKPKAGPKSNGAKQPETAAKRAGRGQKADVAVTTDMRPLDVAGMISRDYVVVDLKALEALIDGMMERFKAQVEELEAVKSALMNNH